MKTDFVTSLFIANSIRLILCAAIFWHDPHWRSLRDIGEREQDIELWQPRQLGELADSESMLIMKMAPLLRAFIQPDYR